MLPSGKGGIGTFIGICLISAAFGVADAHVQGGMVGDLALMQPEFIQSFLAGIAASGALTSGLRLATKAAFEHSHDGLRKGASMRKLLLPIVRYYRAKAASEGSKTVSADLAAAGISVKDEPKAEEDPKRLDRLSMKQLLMKNWDYVLDLYLIYVLTLSIFPGFLSEDTGNHALGSWYALVLISMYNVMDLIGRYIPRRIYIESRKGLMIVIMSRFLFVPAFYFTAKYGAQGWMIMLTSLLGITNGYLTVCVLTIAPNGYKFASSVVRLAVLRLPCGSRLGPIYRTVHSPPNSARPVSQNTDAKWSFLVQGPEANALGNLLVMFLLGGIFSGVALDWLWLIGKGW
ncbi:Equilibrative nucleotide transporter 3 [Platanthera guangdongensis]|uniref:Equilibrative nucleotide transporter 3 n=1 Tax=Platanthera guangdongensis TaxID=2320717 RepID=A0ABR2M9W1_9ASPA